MSTKSVQVGGGMEILRRRGAESMQLLLRHMEAARPVAPLPLLTCQAVLKSPDAFFGLGERCVAIESLLFLVEVMQAVRVSLSQLSVPKSASDVKSIFKEIVEHVEELREMIYSRFPHICISMSDIVNQIAHMKWDSKDLAQRHSQYVDVIHERFLQFFSALDQMRKFLPDEMRPILLRASILHIMENLVEGYSKIRHVGPNTPLLMSNDINTLKSAMEMIPGMEEFGLKPLPFFTHVELFIKGYFLPPDSPQVMVEWAYQHPFYPPHQVLGLVQAVIESNSHHTSSFSALMGQGKSKSTEVKRVLAQVEEAVRTNVSPSASMSLHALAMAR
uniref:Syndetin C-terminal domain-containing protein n=2 Tax=Guillardia theta TaxID=55529 RepID=A0A7S4UPW7_GUITH